MERSHTCCFTGHRTLPNGVALNLIARVTDGVNYLLGLGYRDFVLGGALGFDTICARALICMKVSGYDFGIHLVLPCRDQDATWLYDDKTVYREILRLADSVEFISETYTPSCMSERNKRMVELSSACIAYVEHSKSGAGQTLRLAQSAGLSVYNLAKKPARLE